MPADAAASSPSASDLQERNDKLSSKLRESELRLALVTDAVAEGIYEWNIETNALWQSQRLRKIFGLAGRELKAGDWNELVHRDDFEGYRSALRDCFRGNSARLDCEYRVKHTDGSYRWLEDRAVAVRNAVGRAADEPHFDIDELGLPKLRRTKDDATVITETFLNQLREQEGI